MSTESFGNQQDYEKLFLPNSLQKIHLFRARLHTQGLNSHISTLVLVNTYNLLTFLIIS